MQRLFFTTNGSDHLWRSRYPSKWTQVWRRHHSGPECDVHVSTGVYDGGRGQLFHQDLHQQWDVEWNHASMSRQVPPTDTHFSYTVSKTCCGGRSTLITIRQRCNNLGMPAHCHAQSKVYAYIQRSNEISKKGDTGFLCSQILPYTPHLSALIMQMAMTLKDINLFA